MLFLALFYMFKFMYPLYFESLCETMVVRIYIYIYTYGVGGVWVQLLEAQGTTLLIYVNVSGMRPRSRLSS